MSHIVKDLETDLHRFVTDEDLILGGKRSGGIMVPHTLQLDHHDHLHCCCCLQMVLELSF